jgi:hypothetical protein
MKIAYRLSTATKFCASPETHGITDPITPARAPRFLAWIVLRYSHTTTETELPHGEKVRRGGVQESQTRAAQAQARHAAQRPLGQQGHEPQAGDRKKT